MPRSLQSDAVGLAATPSRARGSDADLVDAFVAASRALVAVAARSLAGIDDDVTLPQYRAMVVLATRGSRRGSDLADALGVSPSTATRMVDRLVRKGLARRVRDRDDRRTLRIHLTEAGAEIVTEVTAARRAEIAGILGQMPERGRRAATGALRSFAAAAGESPEPDWALGWDS